MLSDIPGGLGEPTQYSILNTLPLDPNPRTLSIIVTVGLGQRCCQIYQGAEVGQLDIQYSILYPWTLTPEPWASLSMLGWGSEVLSDIPGGLGGPTQYSILFPWTLTPEPKASLSLLGWVRGAVRYTRGPRWAHSILNTQYFTLGP